MDEDGFASPVKFILHGCRKFGLNLHCPKKPPSDFRFYPVSRTLSRNDLYGLLLHFQGITLYSKNVSEMFLSTPKPKIELLILMMAIVSKCSTGAVGASTLPNSLVPPSAP
jgi:hypothetical protein